METKNAAEVDLSEFEAEDRDQGCLLAHMEFDEEQRTKIQAALSASKISHAKIARVLRSWGFTIAPQTVGRHRRGDCSCAH